MLRRTALYCLSLVLLGACGGSDSTAPVGTLNGAYDLKTINGAALPFIISQDLTTKVEWTSDVVTANGGSFTELSTYRVTQNGQASISTSSDAGSYSINGTAVSFVFNSDGSTGTGTINGNTFTVADQGFSFYYVHQ